MKNSLLRLSKRSIARIASAALALLPCLVVDIVQAGPVPLLDNEELREAVRTISSKRKMDSQELEALLQELEAMRRTDERDAAAFVVRAATPERIDRLYGMPEVALIPKSLRENGLIFAGRAGSKLLAFEKPSDVIGKVSRWFPKEIAHSRTKNRLSGGDVHLWGPFENWETEPAAFMAMWNCTPQSAWLQPDRNPFRFDRNIGNPLMPLGASSSDYTEFDFGQCVRERNGYRSQITLKDSVDQKKRVRAIAERVVPVLRGKFHDFLRTNRCRGTGPDDCVLVMHLWASLTPSDPQLAGMVQSLEADVAPDSPLPAMKKPFDRSRPDIDAGAQRFDEAWRRAAFLRAKLVSILAAPDAWPADALQQTLRQVIALQKPIQDPYAYHYYYNDISYRAAAISPWLVLYSELRRRDKGSGEIPADLLSWEERPREAAVVNRVRAAVIDELSAIDGKVECGVFEPWLTPVVKSEYALRRLQQPGAQLPECVSPDWKWLAVTSEDAVRLRPQYLDLVRTANDRTREMLLSRLTGDGEECFGGKKNPLPDWKRSLCTTWIHEPAVVSPTLANTRLTLDKRHQFRKVPVEAASHGEDAPNAWLKSLTEGLPAEARAQLGAYAKELERKGQRVESAIHWRHAGHSRSLVELGLADGNCTRLFLLLSPREVKQIAIPERIWSGSLCHSEIVRVSDLDHDGSLELWWALEEQGAALFDRCAGNESDLKRGLNCSAKREPAKMAEVSGDTLTYFVDHRSAKPEAPPYENWASSGDRSPQPTASPKEAKEAMPCNRVLVGSVLFEKLGIDGAGAEAGGEVIDLACAQHPGNPDHTLVALFHEIPTQDAAADSSQVGFVAAVVDIKRRKLLRLFRETIEEDASTRIRGGGSLLKLDTARYNLMPNVRAFGVRMNIGYSPRYAEGGSSNYLTLFVEEGSELRPVLKFLPMSAWSLVDSGECFSGGEAPCLIDQEEKTLALGAASTNGWRDLDVITTTTREGEAGAAKRKTEKLRYREGVYR